MEDLKRQSRRRPRRLFFFLILRIPASNARRNPKWTANAIPKSMCENRTLTIGLARERLKIGLTNLAYNMRRFVWLRDRHPPA
jgi:hypothetical protein